MKEWIEDTNEGTDVNRLQIHCRNATSLAEVQCPLATPRALRDRRLDCQQITEVVLMECPEAVLTGAKEVAARVFAAQASGRGQRADTALPEGG